MNLKPASKLRVVKGEFGNRDIPNKIARIQPFRDPPKQQIALGSEPTDVLRNPTDIHIDPEFQRNISDRGKTLIAQMIAKWDWGAFVKPAIYFDKDHQVEMAFDGQHTLIGAASRNDISMLPMSFHPEITNAREAAAAFVVRNTQRLGVTALQKYKAALFAGFGWAMKIDAMSKKLNFTIPQYASNADKPDTVICVTHMQNVLEERGERSLEQIMAILTGIAIAPIREAHIRALELLIHDPSFAGLTRPDWLKGVIRSLNNVEAMRTAETNRIGTGMTRGMCLANVYLTAYQARYGVR